MKLRVYWSSFLVFFLLASCQEVIELDLGNAEPRIIIEGLITTESGPHSVKISQSVDFGETNRFPPVSGGLVSISDRHGNDKLLEEDSPGEYLLRDFQGDYGNTYQLNVEIGNEKYTAV